MNKILTRILITLIIILSALIYSRFLGIKGLITHEIVIKDNIPITYNGLKIVHISDLYYGNDNQKELKSIVNRINLIKPDIVVFTGDLLYKDTKVDNKLQKLLSEINVSIDKYYITGDNDYKNEDITNLLNNSGFTNLNDTYNLSDEDKVKAMTLINTASIYNQLLIRGGNLSRIREYFSSKEVNNMLLATPMEQIPTLSILLIDVENTRVFAYTFPIIFYVCAILIVIAISGLLIISFNIYKKKDNDNVEVAKAETAQESTQVPAEENDLKEKTEQ